MRRVERLLHGTNRRALRLLRERGQLQTRSPMELTGEIEREFQLPAGAVWEHSAFEFSRARQADPHIYLTSDPRVAASHAADGSEMTCDALRAVWMITRPDGEFPSDRNRAFVRFRRDWQDRNDHQGVVLSFDVPHSAIERSPTYTRHLDSGRGDLLTVREWLDLCRPLNTLMLASSLPEDWLAGAAAV